MDIFLLVEKLSLGIFMGCWVEMLRTKKTYADYKAAYKEKQCKLLTTEEEYESDIKLLNNKIFKIQYKCGHTCDKCWHHMFMSRGSNATCRICNKQSVSDLDTLDIEGLSIKYFTDIAIQSSASNFGCFKIAFTPPF